ncbi:MAG: hypothetical protein EBR82_31460 [Caulobacteraceae bacterium]|nr:hypothetical protein [Caulobacteraceae bacterium]
MLLDPVTIVELEQPRCALRFGVGACTATGTPKCFNTWTTCKVKSAYSGTGSIRWRFIQSRPGLFAVGDYSNADNPATDAIPTAALSVTVSKGSLNAAGILDGKSPAGVRSTITVTMDDIPWPDPIGDFYKADRTVTADRTFWALWTARNAFFGSMWLRIYDGYAGQTLAEMRQRVFVLDSVDGPDASGKVTLTGSDPLLLVTSKKAKFPEEMTVTLTSAITAAQTSITVTTSEPAKLTKAYGNSGQLQIKIGSEIITYTAVTDNGNGTYTLTGCTRAALGTTAATGSSGAACQRIGRYVDTPTWQIAYDLLVTHSALPSAFVDFAAWYAEGDTYLPTLRSTITITSAETIDDLLGEACQQGQFYFWWDEYAQQVKMLAVRPPGNAVANLTWQSSIVAGSTVLTRSPDDLVTRVYVYYGQINPTVSKTTTSNYQTLKGSIEADSEGVNAANGAKSLTIYGRFINTEAHAVQVITRILSRYKTIPRFLTLRLDAKDRTLTVGQVCDVTAREIVDSEGNIDTSRWQIISWEEITPGEVYAVDLQTYDYLGAFAYWMADGSPTWETATDAQKAQGAWWAGADGLMADGSAGMQWQ